MPDPLNACGDPEIYCDTFRIDLTSESFGQCKCGFKNADHPVKMKDVEVEAPAPAPAPAPAADQMDSAAAAQPPAAPPAVATPAGTSNQPNGSFLSKCCPCLGGGSSSVPKRVSRLSVPKKPTICGSLVYDDSAQGTLQLHYTRDAPVEGALAFFETEDAVPEFKLNSNCGRTDIIKGVGGPNPRKYYEGWSQFVKLAQGWTGDFTHLANKDAKPVALYITDENIKVTRVKLDEPIDLSEVVCVAIVPKDCLAYSGVTKLELGMFKVNAKNANGVSLDIGAASSPTRSAPPSPIKDVKPSPSPAPAATEVPEEESAPAA